MKVAVFLFLLMHLLSTNGLQLSEDGFLTHQLSNTSLELPSYEIAEGNNLTLQWRSPNLMDLSTLHINCYLKADPERMLIYMVGGVQKYQEEGKLSGRVQCDREALKQGQVRLLLTQLTPLDSGEYQCEMAANYDPDKDWAFLATKHFKLLVTSISLVSTTTLQVYNGDRNRNVPVVKKPDPQVVAYVVVGVLAGALLFMSGMTMLLIKVPVAPTVGSGPSSADLTNLPLTTSSST